MTLHISSQLQLERKKEVMNNFVFEISMFPLVISTALRVIAASYFLRVMFLAYGETGVKNGIVKLRFQLFISATVLFLINTLGLFVIFLRTFLDDGMYQFASNGLSLFNSFGLLFISWVNHQIYTQQYTAENKEFHRRVEEMENHGKPKRKSIL